MSFGSLSPEQRISGFNKNATLGALVCCTVIGIAFTINTRGPEFNLSYQQFLLNNYLQLAVTKIQTIEHKPGMTN